MLEEDACVKIQNDLLNDRHAFIHVQDARLTVGQPDGHVTSSQSSLIISISEGTTAAIQM